MDKIIIIIIIILGLTTVYANFWGLNECTKVGGNWISMNGGSHCMNKQMGEIDIYK